MKKRDRDAAEILIKANYKKLYNFLLKTCRQKEMAQDLTQETFIKAWDSIDKFRSDCRFSTWLIGIAYNKFLDMKKQNEIPIVDCYDKEIENYQENDYEMFADKKNENNGKLQNAVSLLPEISQEIVFLHYQNNLTFSEISKQSPSYSMMTFSTLQVLITLIMSWCNPSVI